LDEIARRWRKRTERSLTTSKSGVRQVLYFSVDNLQSFARVAVHDKKLLHVVLLSQPLDDELQEHFFPCSERYKVFDLLRDWHDMSGRPLMEMSPATKFGIQKTAPTS
jgi:hypothetical protein